MGERLYMCACVCGRMYMCVCVWQVKQNFPCVNSGRRESGCQYCPVLDMVELVSGEWNAKDWGRSGKGKGMLVGEGRAYYGEREVRVSSYCAKYFWSFYYRHSLKSLTSNSTIGDVTYLHYCGSKFIKGYCAQPLPGLVVYHMWKRLLVQSCFVENVVCTNISTSPLNYRD